ncbi:galectin-4 [Puma concolor]|uniref:Galectin n=1 Tax=Puma concolor TaxID=9696 RepID=A0A6P6H5E0_PUMCO|nr:galectin-4 [Puma concolor]
MAYVPVPGYQPTYNPTLPYNKPIPGGLCIGMSVYIQGVASEHMKRHLSFLTSQTMEGPPIFNPPVPFRRILQGGLTARRTIIVKGFIPPTGKSFAINFIVGSTGDMALHINSRLTEDTVVRNSYLNGSWGSEERKISYNPFGPGKFFDLSIRCGIDRFKVYANGQHLFDYSHRFSAFQNVDVLEIQGDINLSYIQI